MPVVTPAPAGGAYRPLSDTDRDRIVEHAFEMLEHVGMADAPDRYAELLIAAGGRRRNDGRVLLPRPMVEAALDRCLLYTSPSPRDGLLSRMPSSA